MGLIHEMRPLDQWLGVAYAAQTTGHLSEFIAAAATTGDLGKMKQSLVDAIRVFEKLKKEVQRYEEAPDVRVLVASGVRHQPH